MVLSAGDVVPFIQARTELSDGAGQAQAGAEMMFSKNGETCGWRRRDRIR